ncbi:DNA polymerase eta-like protein [Sphaerosporella brunnea]|uniref:DNA polymerase eta n=1 Tax=Sphaerosporella brunnea TaxID=1250544 RepID=A0A5J5EZF2_9PEZI|nr:DNA polymerase eta-like protein [Sphaerosporella brunnea]
MESPRKSKFTYRHLQQPSKYSIDSPLRVIALVDLDAFYAQCETKRLGLSPEQPLAVQQWQSLIAVNYPSRAAGVTRHMTASEAKKLCPNIYLAHVATWSAGSSSWSYSPAGSPPDINTSKACLDPYRAESKKILKILQDLCPNAHTEKASIDESFLDLSRDCYERLLTEYECLRNTSEHGDELLPLPEVKELEWSGSHLVPAKEGEEGEIDWDDIAMSIGADIIKNLRSAVYEQLGYTCSAGIASNKMLAKLGAGYKKPNQQSVVRPCATTSFLSAFEFTKIRNLGGKLGSQIASHFHTTSLQQLLSVTLPQFQALLADDTAVWVYNTLRGHDRSPVLPKSSIKSILSAKSFRQALPAFAAAKEWLQVLIADIGSRLDDEGPGRRPKTLTLHFTAASGGRSNVDHWEARHPLEARRKKSKKSVTI